ncbi:hypothetical protein EYF80_038573 [Liparis tanakae]|uniref:Uncharacterized protein n=1 Tax=Liparis tanakae TaxID=230148 RepID=A0A4Z2GED4_9TELE|nr:hypothetical protein EYF80_038573 [Liparis tanakae]
MLSRSSLHSVYSGIVSDMLCCRDRRDGPGCSSSCWHFEGPLWQQGFKFERRDAFTRPGRTRCPFWDVQFCRRLLPGPRSLEVGRRPRRLGPPADQIPRDGVVGPDLGRLGERPVVDGRRLVDVRLQRAVEGVQLLLHPLPALQAAPQPVGVDDVEVLAALRLADLLGALGDGKGHEKS